MYDLLADVVYFSVHGGADGGGVAGIVAGFLDFVESLLSLSPGQMFARLMPGISVMENWHPLFVHFPIALLTLFFLLDVAGSVFGKADWRRMASWCLVGGAFFAGLTVVMGLLAAGSVAHGGDVHDIMSHHKRLGVSVFLLAGAMSVWRLLSKTEIKGAANTLNLLLGAVLIGLLLFAADLGGLMVYGYGVAVEPMAEVNRAAAVLHQHGDDIRHEDHDHGSASVGEATVEHDGHDHHAEPMGEVAGEHEGYDHHSESMGEATAEHDLHDHHDHQH